MVVFPELGITGYSCGDLFRQQTLLDRSEKALAEVVRATEDEFDGLAVVGLPVAAGNRLYNVAAALSGGRILGLVPKIHIPNYGEFYEARHFASGGLNAPLTVNLAGQSATL
ncbi:MAG: nitrilase-related carbon-nitrogen hydrolase, partial [Planctomycetaceae bacterium]